MLMVYLYRTRPRLGAFAKEKLKSFIQNATAEHDFSLFYLDQRANRGLVLYKPTLIHGCYCKDG